jgi:hypothetical protein
MTKRIVDLRGGEFPFLDIWTIGRGAQITAPYREAIARTVGYTPEVVVKVSGGAREGAGALAHLRYIGRHGRLPLYLDDGTQIKRMAEVKSLLQEWGIDIEEREGKRPHSGKPGSKSPRLTRHVVFSMPAGTNDKKVLIAVQRLAQEEWGEKQRYLMALHIDTPRPHVHVVLKAKNEDGERLDISRETLQRWRSVFARHLRAQGVDANATSRVVRGVTRSSTKDDIHRASMRGDSTWMRKRAESVGRDLRAGQFKPPASKEKLVKTRERSLNQYRRLIAQLKRVGDADLAERARAFVRSWAPPQTDQERIAATLLQQAQRSRHDDPGRVR